MLATNIKIRCNVIGVEYFEEKHKIALWMKQQYEKSYDYLNKVLFLNMDVL